MDNFLAIRIDMRLTDQHLLGIIREQIDPSTGRAKLTLFEISELAGCSDRTARRSVKRLESLGHIKRYETRGRGKTEFEVVKNA